MKTAQFLVAGVVFLACRPAFNTERPTAPPKRVIAWIIGGAQSLDSLRRNLSAIDVVSPAYYKVVFSPSGTALAEWDPGNPVQRGTLRSLTTQARAPLVPLVACLDECAVKISKVLSDPSLRSSHVRAILDGIQPDSVDGVFIDYEGITCSAQAFSAFIDQLARELARRNLKLGVAVTEPCGWKPTCEREGYPFDLRHLAAVTDYLAIMEYDYTVDGSTSVAPKDWIVRGMRRTRQEVGGHRAKVFVGVPFYGRITKGLAPDTAVLWSDVSSGTLYGKPLKVLERYFDPEKLAQVALVSYGAPARPGTLHYEDHESVKSRLAIIEAEGFTGIAIWRLGGEDPCAWDMIRAWKRGAKGECPRPSPKPLAHRKRSVIGWMIGGAQSMQSLTAHGDALDVVSPAFYRLSVQGDRAVLAEWDPGNPANRSAIRAFARERKLPLVPLVACGGACAREVSAWLDAPARRAALAQAIADGVAADQADGTFLDFQGLTCAPAAFTAFVDLLATTLHLAGRRLGVAITEPCGVSPDCHRPGYPFDLGRLARAVDYLAVLEYDFAVDGSDSVAPRHWLVRGLTKLRAETGEARARVYVGVPFYGRISPDLSTETAVLWADIAAGRVHGQPLRILERRFVPEKLAQEARVQHGLGLKPGTLFYEDHESVAARLSVIEGEGFSGIAVWRLGGEDPCNWDAIRAWKNGDGGKPVACRR